MRRFFGIAILATACQFVVSNEAVAPPDFMKERRVADLKRYIKKVEIEYQLPPGLLLAIIETESSFKPKAVNPAGRPGVAVTSYGLGQVTMATARSACNVTRLRTLMQTRVNVRCAAAILKRQLNRYNGEVRATIAAYQTGTACICKGNVFKEPNNSKACRFRRKVGKPIACANSGAFMNQYYVNKVMKNRLKHRWVTLEDDKPVTMSQN